MDALQSYLELNPLTCIVRGNVSDHPVQSATFGLVRCRQQTAPKISEATAQDQFKLLKLLVGLLRQPELEGTPPAGFTSICFNVNFRCAPHMDKYNEGLSTIICGGEFSGGQLFVEDASGRETIEHECATLTGTKLDAKCRWCTFDGSNRHSTMPYTGFRLSVVFFNVPVTHAKPQDMALLQSLGFRVPPAACGMAWPWPYQICICSSGRAQTISQDTLLVLLQDGTVPLTAVTICTTEGQAPEYARLGVRVVTVPDFEGLPGKRRFCLKSAPVDTRLLFLDDDLTGIIKCDHISLHELIAFGFLSAHFRGALLWGLNTSSNKMHLRPNVSTTIGLVNGYFFGLIVSEEAPRMTLTSDSVKGAAEDVERSVRYFNHCGLICRLCCATAIARTYSNKGGLQDQFGCKKSRLAAQEFVIRNLQAEFPKLVTYDSNNWNRCAFNRRRELGEAQKHCCETCGKDFSRKADLTHHVLWEHTDAPRQLFECEICHQQFKTKRALGVHLKLQRCFRIKGRPKTTA